MRLRRRKKGKNPPFFCYNPLKMCAFFLLLWQLFPWFPQNLPQFCLLEENKINVLTMKLPVLRSIVSLTYLHWLITALHSTCTRYNIIHSITAASHAFLSGSAFYSWNLTLPVRNYSEHRTHLSKFNSMMLFGPLNRQNPRRKHPKIKLATFNFLLQCCNRWTVVILHDSRPGFTWTLPSSRAKAKEKPKNTDCESCWYCF